MRSPRTTCSWTPAWNWTPGARSNPPLRRRADREAIFAAFCRGEVPMLATDHAPHAPDEKERGFGEAPSGVPGVETGFAMMLALVKKGHLSLETSGQGRLLHAGQDVRPEQGGDRRRAGRRPHRGRSSRSHHHQGQGTAQQVRLDPLRRSGGHVPPGRVPPGKADHEGRFHLRGPQREGSTTCLNHCRWT